MSRELDEFLRRQEQAPQAAAQARINAGRQQQPAQAAEIAQASRGLGVPQEVVSAAPDTYKQQAASVSDNLALGRSSRLAGWLAQNETNAPVARGAFSGLADMQSHIDKTGAAKPKNTPDRTREALAGLGVGVGGGVGYDAFNFVKNTIAAVTSGDVNTSKVGSALASGTAGAATGIAGFGEAALRTMDKYSPIAIAERSLFGQSLEGMAADRAQSQSRKWDKAAQYLHPETATEEGAGVISGFESLPLSAAGLLGGAYFRSAKLATGVISAVVGGQSYRKGIDEGLSNERAILFGATDAAIEYATEILPTGAILKSVGAKGKFGKNLADLLVSEIPGEQLATLGQDFNQWFSIDANKGKTFQSYLDERPAAAKQTLLATLVGAGTVTSAVSAAEFAAAKLGRDLPRALPAEENARFLDALGRLSAASEVLKRDKGTFEDWVRTAAEDTEVTDVFVDAEQLAKIFDQSNLDPEQAFAITGLSPEQLQQAVQRGDSLSIPIEKYASEIATSPISAQLIPHLRVSPDDMSIEEAKVFLQGAKDEFAKDVEDTFAKSQQEDVLRTSHDAVRESVAAQLKGTGRFNSSVVDTYSGLTAAFYTTLGGKLGLTAEETASRYPLRIQSGEVAQPTFDQPQGAPSVNIGLDIPGGGTLDPEVVRAALTAAGVSITAEAIHQSDSEQTLVAELDKPLSKEQLFALSAALGQEGIAQSLGDGTGMLEGPQAALWGDFNPEFFFDLQGKRLREPADPQVFNQDEVAEFYAGSASLAGHNPQSRYMVVNDQTKDEHAGGQETNPRASVADAELTLDAAAAALSDGGVLPFQLEFFPGQNFGINPAALPDEYIEMEDGTDRPSRNADGEFIASTNTAIRNFWKWFGDSEMVDTDGRPIVFYHGTKADFRKVAKRQFAFDTKYTSTFFFATDSSTADAFAAKTEGGEVLKAYLRAESVDKYDADGRMWDEVVPLDDYEESEAQQAWLDDQMEAFEPSAYVEETDDGVWELVGPEASPQKFDDEDEANEALEEAHDAEREAHEDSLREDMPYGGDLVELGYLDKTGQSTDALAAEAMDRYDAVLIDDVDEGSGATTVAIMLGEPANIKATDNIGTFDGNDPRIYNQSPIENPLDAFRRESFYPTRATRLEDGTVLAGDVPNWYPDRLAKIAEKIGAAKIEGVDKNDPRLDTGTPLWFTAPPIEADGMIRLDHWGPVGVTTTDPTMWGAGNTLPPSERLRVGVALPRTYFGIASGLPGGYVIEFPTNTQYEARVDPATLYDIGKDPDGLKKGDGVGPLEHRIKDAGYTGYWSNNEQLGLVATIFEPLPVKPASAQVLNQDAVFYSALERAVENSTTKKAPAAQWIATLQKTPGVKQEELEWTGLLDFLADVEGPVTQEAILELVRSGGIRTDEVVLGGRDKRPFKEQVATFTAQGLSEAEAEEAVFAAREEANPTQFSSWTTDQNSESYRELLITLPLGQGGNPNRAASTHWDIDGVVAHARFMDKTDADGKKVLFVEEVQSDWHQKGRDQGYAAPIDPVEQRAALAALGEARTAFVDAQKQLTRAQQEGPVPDSSPLFSLVDQAVLRVQEAQQRANNAASIGGIPNAPFKTTWPALAMKRMIRYAAEHGYERIAWTTGKQQSERYNLSTAVGTITVVGHGQTDGFSYLSFENDGVLGTLTENGLAERNPGYRSEVRMTPEQMKTAFGADIAQRIIDSPSLTEISGEGLNVGGEGMRAFYDRNLVNITNGLIKKHGAKVGTVTVSNNASTARALAAGRGSDATAVAQARAFGAITDQPGFDITPSLADAAMGGQPLFQKTGAPRGQIAFAPDITKTPSVITVLRGADLSTFVHELGHFFFEVTNHVASQAGAPQQLIDDRDAMLRYIGVKSISEWEAMTPEARRNGHEIVARSFEAYLFEGKAPSIEMRGIFQRLRGWMMNVYRTITRLNVSLTEEVRSAFDRMLASEEQIRDTEADAAMAPQFAEKPEGMSDADWADYQQLGTDATAEASEALARRSLRDMQYAGRSVAREIKRLQAEMKERRDAMREEVEAEISAKPIYQAITFLRKGTIGESQPEEFHKLDTTIVREVLQLDADMPLPDALKGMTSTKDGVNPEQVAELFGYSSADHLIKDLLFASPMKEAIEAETDARMRERYGEVAHPDQLDEAARAAVHNDVRGRFVATELAALQKAPGKKRVLDGAARRLASEMIARLRIRDLRPGQYENAERKAAKAAQKAGTTNIDEAVRQKRNQLFQFHAAKAAHEAIEETRKARDYLSKFANKNTRAALDSAYLDQIDQLLERFELRQISNKEADRRKSIADWIKSQEDLGFEPTLDPDFLDEVGRKPWRDLTVEEMRELVDGIKNIEFLARRTKELLTAIDKANLDEAAGEVAQSIRANALTSRPEIVGNKTWLEGVKNGVRDFFAMHRKMANLLYVFDGNVLGGPSWERFMRGANRAGDAETQALRDAGSVLEPLFKSLGDTLRREYIPEIERSLNLQDRLMIALNWGNATNRARVMDGDKWTPEQVEAILEPLTPAHWDFVEAVWAHINSYRQQIIDKEMRVSGVEPKMVEAEPFQVANPDGTLRLITGGYFPIKYDPDRSSKAEADTAADIAKQMQRGLYTRATTRRGHLKERVDSVANRPIRKDFGVIFEHNAQVIHDLSWHEYLIDANRLLRHGAVDSAIREHYGPETLRWMRKALEDMASGDVPAQNSFERGVNYVRTGATVAGLGWNLFTSLLQPVGLTQSWSRIGAKWVGRGVGELLGNPAQMNEKVQWIYSVSPFMRARGDTMQREINEIRNTLAAKGPIRSALDKAISPEVNDAISSSFFVMIAKAQLMADLPTWLGQYHKSLESGQSEERAIELANQSVIDSQGSGMIKDLAGVQKGSPLWKLWTNFYSYFSVTYNLLVDRTTELRRVGPKDLPFFAVDVTMLTVVPATLTAIMRALLKGDEPDEPEDWAKLVAKENLSYMLGLVLGLREVGAALTGDAGYRGPAGARLIGDMSNLGKQAAQGEADEALLRAVNNTAGVLLHYPAGQVDRAARGLYYVSKGEAGVMAPLVGPPKDAGQ